MVLAMLLLPRPIPKMIAKQRLKIKQLQLVVMAPLLQLTLKMILKLSLKMIAKQRLKIKQLQLVVMAPLLQLTLKMILKLSLKMIAKQVETVQRQPISETLLQLIPKPMQQPMVMVTQLLVSVMPLSPTKSTINIWKVKLLV